MGNFYIIYFLNFLIDFTVNLLFSKFKLKYYKLVNFFNFSLRYFKLLYFNPRLFRYKFKFRCTRFNKFYKPFAKNFIKFSPILFCDKSNYKCFKLDNFWILVIKCLKFGLNSIKSFWDNVNSRCSNKNRLYNISPNNNEFF